MKRILFHIGFQFFHAGVGVMLFGGLLMGKDEFNRLVGELCNPERAVWVEIGKRA